MEIHKYQVETGVFSKVGKETRKTVPRLWGAYWYNKGLKAGLECFDRIYSFMAKNEVLYPLLEELDDNGRTKRVVLKRGCTEFEEKCGDPKNWVITPEQNAVEDLLDVMVVNTVDESLQSEHLIWDVKQRWIEFAWETDDPTFPLYSGPLYKPYVTYHQPELVKEEAKDEDRNRVYGTGDRGLQVSRRNDGGLGNSENAPSDLHSDA